MLLFCLGGRGWGLECYCVYCLVGGDLKYSSVYCWVWGTWCILFVFGGPCSPLILHKPPFYAANKRASSEPTKAPSRPSGPSRPSAPSGGGGGGFNPNDILKARLGGRKGSTKPPVDLPPPPPPPPPSNVPANYIEKGIDFIICG